MEWKEVSRKKGKERSDMFSEKEILNKMEQYQGEPESAEVWYLIAEGLETSEINNNLRTKYGSSQGYVKFKEDIREMVGGEVIDGFNPKIRLEDKEEELESAPVSDVGDDFSNVVKNAFLSKVEMKLREKMEETLPDLSEDAKLLVKILKKRERTGNPIGRFQEIWEDFSFLTGKELPKPRKKDLKELLIKVHCYYSDLGITPMLANLAPSEKYLPEIKISYHDKE